MPHAQQKINNKGLWMGVLYWWTVIGFFMLFVMIGLSQLGSAFVLAALFQLFWSHFFLLAAGIFCVPHNQIAMKNQSKASIPHPKTRAALPPLSLWKSKDLIFIISELQNNLLMRCELQHKYSEFSCSDWSLKPWNFSNTTPGHGL